MTGKGIQQRDELGDVVAVPVSVTARGVPPASVIRWCLEPGLPRSMGLWPVWSPFESPQLRGVDKRVRQLQLPGGAQFAQ